MTNCVNCENLAKYLFKVTPNPRTDTYYCPAHLPRFLYPQMTAGLLNIPVDAEPDPVPATKKNKKETVEPVETPEESKTDNVE